MKSFATLTMKSKRVWMKSSLRSDEIKSVFYPCGARFHHEVISSALADLFRPNTDLTEKSTCKLQVLFSGSSSWARTSDIMINSHALYRLSYRGILSYYVISISLFFQNIKYFKRIYLTDEAYSLRPLICSGSVLSSRAVARQVLSTLRSLTSVFGMGTGGASSL